MVIGIVLISVDIYMFYNLVGCVPTMIQQISKEIHCEKGCVSGGNKSISERGPGIWFPISKSQKIAYFYLCNSKYILFCSFTIMSKFCIVRER